MQSTLPKPNKRQKKKDAKKCIECEHNKAGYCQLNRRWSHMVDRSTCGESGCADCSNNKNGQCVIKNQPTSNYISIECRYRRIKLEIVNQSTNQSNQSKNQNKSSKKAG